MPACLEVPAGGGLLPRVCVELLEALCQIRTDAPLLTMASARGRGRGANSRTSRARYCGALAGSGAKGAGRVKIAPC